jgi:hypothetical protein
MKQIFLTTLRFIAREKWICMIFLVYISKDIFIYERFITLGDKHESQMVTLVVVHEFANHVAQARVDR